MFRLIKPAFPVFLLFIICCKNNTGISPDQFPEKIKGSWEYDVEKMFFTLPDGKIDSTVKNASNRLAITRIENGKAIDRVFVTFSNDSLYNTDHYNSAEGKVKIRQAGLWYVKADTLAMQSKDKTWIHYLCAMPSDSILNLRLELDKEGKEWYTATLKKYR